MKVRHDEGIANHVVPKPVEACYELDMERRLPYKRRDGQWRCMREADLEAVKALSDQVHTKYPERIEVLAEKHRLFPTGCFILESASKLVGYCLSHPWDDGMPPRLDTCLGDIPAFPKTYFLHDITLAKKFRGRGFAREVLDLLSSIARMHGIAWLTLVSVYDTAPFWKKNGFATLDGNDVQQYVKTTYGREALAMKKPVM